MPNLISECGEGLKNVALKRVQQWFKSNRDGNMTVGHHYASDGSATDLMWICLTHKCKDTRMLVSAKEYQTIREHLGLNNPTDNK